MRPWSIRRSRLSHDLVSNQLIVCLAALERVASGLVESDDDVRENVRGLWLQIHQESWALHATLLDEMSPRVLFEEPPLCHCSQETKAWLVPFVHERWLSKTSAEVRREELAAAAGDAEAIMNRLLECLAGVKDRSAFAQCVADARAAADRLSDALAAMPKSVLP